MASSASKIGLPRIGAGQPDHEIENVDARLRQFPHRDRAKAQHVAHDVVHAAGVAFLNEGAALDALLQPQHAGHFEAAQRLAQHVAADAELLREIALRRQLVARLEDAERELLANALADFLERAPGVDRPEFRRGRRAGGTMIGGPIAPIERRRPGAGGRAGA